MQIKWLTLFAIVFAPAGATAGPLDVESENLKPGLVAEYHSLVEQDAIVYRIDAKPSFYLGRSSAHPRIPPGRFEVIWHGVIHIQDAVPITLSAFVGGDVSVEIDGATVLIGRGETDSSEIIAKAPFQRESGNYRLTIRFRSLSSVPARLQLMWQAKSFAREPIPAWRFRHLAADVSADAQQDQLAAAGRTLAGKFGCAR